jgi:hypothetical protein
MLPAAIIDTLIRWLRHIIDTPPLLRFDIADDIE